MTPNTRYFIFAMWVLVLGSTPVWAENYYVRMAILIAMFNQLSGINALMYYAPHIFRMAGAGQESALLQAVAVGGTNLVFTMLALAVIDHFGRRKLMITGSIGYIVSLGATAWAFYTYGDAFTAAAEAATAGTELDTAVATAASTGGTIVLEGNPAERLIDLVDREKPDIIVVGKAMKNFFDRLFLGSVSEKILSHASCSVLVIPAAG